MMSSRSGEALTSESALYSCKGGGGAPRFFAGTAYLSKHISLCTRHQISVSVIVSCASRMEADRKLPALKLFISQLNRARQPVQPADVDVMGSGANLVGLLLLGVEFTRVWLQVHSAAVRACCDLTRQHASACTQGFAIRRHMLSPHPSVVVGKLCALLQCKCYLNRFSVCRIIFSMKPNRQGVQLSRRTSDLLYCCCTYSSIWVGGASRQE